jgi:hypothetical protein
VASLEKEPRRNMDSDINFALRLSEDVPKIWENSRDEKEGRFFQGGEIHLALATRRSSSISGMDIKTRYYLTDPGHILFLRI